MLFFIYSVFINTFARYLQNKKSFNYLLLFMKQTFALLAGLFCMALPTLADNDKPTVNVDFMTRVGYLNDRVDNQIRHGVSGFKGEYLLFSISGQLNDRISYAWRQRINQKKEVNDRFDGTDWVYVDYKANDHWNLAAGKQVAMVGGYEYDRCPIDIYLSSEFWNNISPFQFGASATYTTTNGKSRFTGQVTQSLFNTPANRDMFAYHLHWAGSYGWFNSLYSVNMVEYEPSRFISYIALGNKFNVGNASLELDFMNRAASHQTFLLKDCSVMARFDYKLMPQLGLYGKFTYDVNRTDTEADKCVHSGTEMTAYGGGVEVYPIKNRNDVRVSLGMSHSQGTNSNPSGALNDNQTTVRLSFIAKLHLLSWKSK